MEQRSPPYCEDGAANVHYACRYRGTLSVDDLGGVLGG